jgi:hypothetical protein
LPAASDDESVVVGGAIMMRSGLKPVDLVDSHSEFDVVTLERLERRLTEECGQLRLDVSGLRTEVADRNAALLKWLLVFFVAQTTALAALMTALR